MAARVRPATRFRGRRSRSAAACAALIAAACGAATVGCAPVPRVRSVGFGVDVDELADPRFLADVDEAIAGLHADPALHLHIIGHADEDNTVAYNFDLSRRRAAHVRELIVARHPELADRITTSGHGELDPREPGESAQAKRANRRVEFVFHYPRVCEPGLDLDFLACELERVDPPPEVVAAGDPVDTATDEPPAAAPAIAPEAAASRGWSGGYLHGGVGVGIGVKEQVRRELAHGLAGGAAWQGSAAFRLGLGLAYDGFTDLGPLFAATSACEVGCAHAGSDYYRLAPELRLGGVRGRLWAYGRLLVGAVAQVPERGRASVGASVGGGLGVHVRLVRGLYLGIDSTLTASRFTASERGAGLYDLKALLGWRLPSRSRR